MHPNFGGFILGGKVYVYLWKYRLLELNYCWTAAVQILPGQIILITAYGAVQYTNPRGVWSAFGSLYSLIHMKLFSWIFFSSFSMSVNKPGWNSSKEVVSSGPSGHGSASITLANGMNVINVAHIGYKKSSSRECSALQTKTKPGFMKCSTTRQSYINHFLSLL